ncbi:MAG: DEAD/DEAH box helicase [Chloroflexi bacterium]|nr:DEAD/DEAH box helicase [Chloroflexota bacterium]
MNLDQFLTQLRSDPQARQRITHWREIPARPARSGPWPEHLDSRLKTALERRGIADLYTHQSEAVTRALAGENVVVVTPTASGKTLCYNLPVLHTVLNDPDARALYFFPTKALAQDQYAELHGLIQLLDAPIKTYTYDGDTPPTARKALRSAGNVIITNPDMLHTGVLPHHTKWVRLFEGLKYVVVDELHTYRGVFGSHVANVIRRLKRLCDYYGSSPQFVCCSATIANPGELAFRVIGEPSKVVDDNGAPSGAKHVVFYNPPVVNAQLGLRRSATFEARDLAGKLLVNDIQTIAFARARVRVEVLLTYLREATKGRLPAAAIRGYRGGYLPNERREIERGLREGSLRGVVSTNALELGVDVGGLEASVLVGYPGSVASAWQQIGRAGRRGTTAAAFFVATSSPLDQFLVQHPEYFFDQPSENGLVNPDNAAILGEHLKCAAFELPFDDGERFGDVATTDRILAALESEQMLYHAGGRWHWTAENFPAEAVSLRSAARENFVIIETTEPKPKVIGELDRYAAPMLLHEEAIYIHNGQQYQVEKLDYPEKKAYVRRVDVDYFTDAHLNVDLKVLEEHERVDEPAGQHAHGEVSVSYRVDLFKKIKLDTHENLGSGPVYLPEETVHTASYWIALAEPATAGLRRSEVEGGLLGLAHAVSRLAPLHLMCDPRDVEVVPQIRSPHTQRPTIFIYESYPGGVGFSPKLYQIRQDLLRHAEALVADCACTNGCPSCVGPALDVGDSGKAAALHLLRSLRSPATSQSATAALIPWRTAG